MLAIASRFSTPWPALVAALVGGAIFAGALGLWGYYGTAVFFEMVRSGWMACF